MAMDLPPIPFDLPTGNSFEGLPPLDMAGAMPSPPPAAGPQAPGGNGAPSPQPKADRRAWLKLAALIPAALKGGPGAMEGLLAGFQQADVQSAEQARLTAADQRAQQQEDRLNQQADWTRTYQQQQLEAQAEQRRGALVKEFTDALLADTLTDDEGVRALTQLYEARGRAMGMRPGSFETTAMQVVKPSRLERQAAERKVRSLQQQFGVANWQQEGNKFLHELPGGRRVTLPQLLEAAGMAANPEAPPQQATDRRGFQRVEAMLDGKAAFVSFDPGSGKYLDAAGQDVTSRVTPMPPDRVVYPAPQGGTDPRTISTFNMIAGAYERSPLIRASDRTIVLSDAIKQIEANPEDSAAQLALAYSYIQALDTYQSAVREGELQNLGVLGTRLQSFMTELNRVVSSGAFLPTEVALNIAQNAKQLVRTIESGRSRKEQEFASRARVSGVGEMWDSFTAGFVRPAPQDDAPTPSAAPVVPPVTPPTRSNQVGPRGGGAAPPSTNPFRRGQ